MADKRWHPSHDKYQENEHPYEDLSSPSGRPKQSSAVGHTSNAVLGESEQYERLRNGRLFSSIYSTQNAIIGDSEFPSLDEFDEYRPKTDDLSFMFMTMVHDGLRMDEDSLKYNRTQKAPEYIQEEKEAVEPEEQQQPSPQSHPIEVQSDSFSPRKAEPPEEPLHFFHEIYGPEKAEWTVEVVCEVETPPETKRLILDKPQEGCQFELEYYELELQLNSPAELTKEILIEGCETIGKQLKQTDSLMVEAKVYHNRQKMWCFKERGESLEDMVKEGHVPSKKLYRELLPLIEKQPDKALHSSNICYSSRLGRYVLDYLRPKRPGQTVTVQNCQRLTKVWASSPEVKAKIGEYQLSEAQFATNINGQKYFGRLIAQLNPEEHYLVGSGTYGKIFIDRTRPSDVVKKRIYYTPANYGSCRLEAVNELCMLRVCSSFLSAEVTSLELRESSHFFEFELERCLSLTKVKLSTEQLDSLSLELESNLLRMHELGIYHRDIKPDNIMYSHRLRRLVLIDFGLSLHPTKQYAGNHFTVYCGTKKLMSDEMALLEAEGAGFVDLANNDQIALRKSLEMIKQSNLERQCSMGLEEAYMDQGSIDEVLRGVVFEKDVDRRGQRGSIFSKMSKLGLVELIERTAAAITKLASPEELFEIVRLLIKHRIGGYSLDKLKDKLDKPLSDTDEEYFQELKVEYEILTSPMPEALERCRQYIIKPNGIWIRKRYMIHEVLRNISTSDLTMLTGNAEELASLYDPTEGTVQLNAILLNNMSAVVKASGSSNPTIDTHMKALANPLLPRIRTIASAYPSIADPLFRILQEISFKDSAKVQQIHSVNLQANISENLSQNSLIIRRVLFTIYNNNCENETLLFQALDSMFLHENGLGQRTQYSHPDINQVVEDIPSVITRASPNASSSLLSMSLFQQDIIQTRNILLMDYKRPTPFELTSLRVLVGDMEVTLQYRLSLINPAQENSISVFLRGKDIAVDVRKHPLADEQRDFQIQQFIREYCIAKILSERGVGTKLFKLMGCDFVIHPQCISYLASRTVKAGSEQRQQCQRDIAETVDYLHRHSIAVRNISPSNLGYDCHLQRYVLTDFSRARGVTGLPSDPNSSRQSYTQLCGNEECLGDQMRYLLQQHELTGNIDLFLNDTQALQRCMNLLERLSSQTANTVQKPKLNHIQYQLKVLLAEQSGNIKWIVQSVNHYLTQHPDFFEKQIQFDYESFLDPTAQPALLPLVDRVQSKMKNKYAIQVLSLRSNFLLDDSFLQISTDLYSLVVLDLSHNGLTFQSAVQLTQQKIPLLRTLILYDNCIGNQALSFLSCGMPELRELNLGCNQLTTLGLEQQVTALSIERLDVSWNNIQLDAQAVELLARLPGLRYLNLQYTHSTLEQIGKLFPQAIRQPTLRRIKLTLATSDALETAYLAYENGAYCLHHTALLQNGEVITTSTELYEPHQQTTTVTSVKGHD